MASTAIESSSQSSNAPLPSAPSSRGARRSLVDDLKSSGAVDSNPCSPRLVTNPRKNNGNPQQEELLLLQLNAMNRQQQLLNSRRIYPCSSSRQQQQEMPRMFLDSHSRNRSGWGSSSSYDLPSASDCSSHSSPVHLIPRRSMLVSKKMVVDEKTLALKLMRARSLNAVAAAAANIAPQKSTSSSSCSSSTSSSSSENASLRASAETIDDSRVKSIDSSRRPQRTTASAAAGSSSGDDRPHDEAENRVAQKKEEIDRSSSSTNSCSSSNQQQQPQQLRLKASDMSLVMQEHAFQCARDVLRGMEKLQCKKVAWELKKEFDKCYGPAWHCIVGTSFGSYVTHSVGGFVYFSIGKVSVLLFQTAVELIEQH